jgi:hypothetical protein
MDSSRLIVKTFLIGIEGLEGLVKGALEISVIIGTNHKCVTLQQTFLLINISMCKPLAKNRQIRARSDKFRLRRKIVVDRDNNF